MESLDRRPRENAGTGEREYTPDEKFPHTHTHTHNCTLVDESIKDVKGDLVGFFFFLSLTEKIASDTAAIVVQS